MFDENDIDFSKVKDIIVIKDLITRVEKFLILEMNHMWDIN